MKYFLIIFIVCFGIFDFLVSNFYFFDVRNNYGSKHDVYHHTLKPNQELMVNFGPGNYKICTNSFGFRVHCENKNIAKKNYKYALIGDSFTEGTFDYDETYAGIFERKFKDTINLGVSSYSNIIYFSKIYHLIEKQNFNFDEVILFFDNTDIIQDQRYILNNDNSIRIKNDLFSSKLESVWKRNNFKSFLHNNFKLSKQIYLMLRDNLFTLDMIIFNDPRIDWAIYDESEFFQKRNIKDSIDYSLSFMHKLYSYLENKNIKFSLVIYPHPTQLLHSNKDSKIVKIFEEFCHKRCHNFVNLHDIFFDEVKLVGVKKVYKEYYIFRDFHFNRKGNQKVAEILFNFYD